LNNNINLGDLYVDDSYSLQEIIVEGYKPVFQQKTDRLVFNVMNDKYLEGLNAIQILERTPRIEVDYNNSIKMIGKESVLIMIDGRLLTMGEEGVKNRLRNLQANNIEIIEVIPVAPARYRVEGNSGMINIVLKKDPNLGFHLILLPGIRFITIIANGKGTD
jgi:hypothetical protein